MYKSPDRLSTAWLYPQGKDTVFSQRSCSGKDVLRSLAALWSLPVDVLIWYLDIARLAVDTASRG
jgi:hypothetical protein